MRRRQQQRRVAPVILHLEVRAGLDEQRCAVRVLVPWRALKGVLVQFYVHVVCNVLQGL